MNTTYEPLLQDIAIILSSWSGMAYRKITDQIESWLLEEIISQLCIKYILYTFDDIILLGSWCGHAF